MVEPFKIILNPVMVFQSISYLPSPHSFLSSTSLIICPIIQVVYKILKSLVTKGFFLQVDVELF